jgi:HEAT repeat protein
VNRLCCVGADDSGRTAMGTIPMVRPGSTTLAHHGDPEIRYQVASALSCSGWPNPDEQTTLSLLELTTDPSPDVRFSALYELAKWRAAGDSDRRIEKTLREHVADPDVRVRQAVADALGATDPASAADSVTAVRRV